MALWKKAKGGFEDKHLKINGYNITLLKDLSSGLISMRVPLGALC